jgi:hypothetical protein
MLWGYQNGIAKGMTGTTFGPAPEINRAQPAAAPMHYDGCEA